MPTFHFEVITPEHIVYRDEVASVSIPTVQGQITVLAHHMPIVTVLAPGELVIRKDSEERPYAVSGGFIEVKPNGLSILADSAEHVSEIDEQRAEEARARAAELQRQVAADSVDYANIAAKLERELARLRVVRKYRHRGSHGITQEPLRRE